MKPRPQPAGPKSVRGSDAARRQAAIVLEALAGLRTTQSASEAMGVALPRYYVLEARGLQALVLAFEPRPRGRQRSPASELERLQSENRRLLREVARYASLYRASQRALGVPDARITMAKQQAGKRRRRPRQRSRAEVVAQTLQAGVPREVAGDAGQA